jgi:hypothetical protein
MVVFNSNHALLAWTNRRSQPICPHGVAFLYADPVTLPEPKPGVESPHWHRVVAATRVVHDTPDVRELPALLYRLIRLARSRYLPTPGGFDPAEHMAVYRDKSSGAAEYVGIGVSTLDAIDISWEQAYRGAEDVDDIGGRVFALLYDHTAILADRGAPRTARGDVGVHSTGELNYSNMMVPRMWTRHHDVSSMPVAREVWDLMYELHQLVYHQNPRPTL